MKALMPLIHRLVMMPSQLFLHGSNEANKQLVESQLTVEVTSSDLLTEENHKGLKGRNLKL
jgi:hypothetical protein